MSDSAEHLARSSSLSLSTGGGASSSAQFSSLGLTANPGLTATYPSTLEPAYVLPSVHSSPREPNHFQERARQLHVAENQMVASLPVSYTHLTLPTKRIV